MKRKGFTWTPGNVSAKDPSKMAIRTYIEQSQLRAVLLSLNQLSQNPLIVKRGLRDAAEFGCGFGRMLPVLGEFAEQVTGFEREASLSAAARKLLPWADIYNVPRLASVPVGVGPFDLAMTFTVLQHMSDKDAAAVIDQMKALATRVLVVEDTDPEYRYVDKRDGTHFTIGRAVSEYRRLMTPFRLVRTWPRLVEPGYVYKGEPRPYVGHYMLFEKVGE